MGASGYSSIINQILNFCLLVLMFQDVIIVKIQEYLGHSNKQQIIGNKSLSDIELSICVGVACSTASDIIAMKVSEINQDNFLLTWVEKVKKVLLI